MLGRRRALVGLAGAAAASAAAVAATAQPVAAANGQAVVIGSEVNTGSSPTGLSVRGRSLVYGLGVTDDGSGPIDTRPALFGHAKGLAFRTGVYGLTDGDSTGVEGKSSGAGVGVSGTSEAGFGLVGHSHGHIGAAISTITGPIALRVIAYGVNKVGVDINAPTPIRMVPTSPTPHPRSAAVTGELRRASDGLYACVAGLQPSADAVWRKVVGPATAGSLHLLDAPVRVYDSRAGTQPAQGPKTPLSPTARMIQVNANGSGVPTSASAVLLTVLLVNAAAGSGNMTIWKGGAAKPQANTAVWGGNAGRFTATAISRIDAQARVSIDASLRTDVVLDVVGYYR